MAQSISIYLVSNLHDAQYRRDYLDLDFANIHNIASLSAESYPWVTSIDEYGHTYIGHLQAPHLIQEIGQLDLPTDQQAEAQKICEALRSLDGEQLLYFAGD